MPGKTITQLLVFALAVASHAASRVPAPAGDELPLLNGQFSLDQCIAIALRNNRARPVSELSVAIAEAQHRQACSSWWPTLNVRGGINVRSHDTELNLRNLTITTDPMALSLPVGISASVASSVPVNLSSQFAQALAANPQLAAALAGNPALAQQLNAVVGQLGANAGRLNSTLTASLPSKIPVPGQTIRVPDQNITVLDRTTYGAGLDARVILFDGGLRSGLTQQSRQGIAAAQQDVRRTDLQIAYDVRRYFAGAVLAARSTVLAKEVVERLDATLMLTEKFYENGTGKVQKNDFLRNKAMLEYVRAQHVMAAGNRELAEAALAMAMGCSWRSEISVRDGGHTPPRFTPDPERLVAEAYSFNPDWAKLHAGLAAAEGALRQQKSGWWPKVALTGRLERFQNDADSGALRNEFTWGVDLGAEIPIFDGFLTSARVQEARARLAKLQQERILLREGVALQVKVGCIRLANSLKRHKLTANAASIAADNRDVCERAYAQEMIEAKTLLDSQTEEALAKSEVHKAAFEQAEAEAQLAFVIGSEVAQRVGGLK